MYDRVLLPTDGSAGMERVIDHAAGLADVHDATLHAMYVVDTASLTDLPMESSWEGVTTALEREGETALEAVERRVSNVDVRTSIVEGSPSRDIVAFADEEDCDLVVMGTHGRAGVERWIIGSVAERVVRESTVPVLTVHVD
jgi:nucleotide-binding universal stress UspA family protein